MKNKHRGALKQWFTSHLVAKRYKNFRRFVYNYESETSNGVTGATDNMSGPKISCKVCLNGHKWPH